jgi:hypothetical protein
MAAVVPISRSQTLIAGLQSLKIDRNAALVAIAALGVIAMLRLPVVASDTVPAQNPPRPARSTGISFRQPPAAMLRAMAPEGSSRDTCVMILGETGASSIGSADPHGEVTVSLAACDLYNEARDAASTRLIGGASLSARNIFLSGGYLLSAGAIMTASRYLATHASPAADPYAGLEIPAFSGCTRNQYRLDARKIETISPGVYCGGIEVAGGATLNLEPGTYVLDQGKFAVGNGAAVNGAGVTIILTSRDGSNYGGIEIRSGSTIAISAPSVGTAAGTPGVAFWADKHAPAGEDFFDGGGSQQINGAIYLPSRRVEYSGGSPSGTSCSQLVASTVAFTGNSYFQHDCSGAGVSDPMPPRQIEE